LSAFKGKEAPRFKEHCNRNLEIINNTSTGRNVNDAHLNEV